MDVLFGTCLFLALLQFALCINLGQLMIKIAVFQNKT